MTASARILVSRLPGYVTPGALPLVPCLVSIHHHLLKPGTWILFRWFEVDGQLEQAAPEFHDALADARLRVPFGFAAAPFPDGWAHMAFAPAREAA